MRAEKNHKLLDVREAADYLGIKVSTLYKWVSQRKIPYIKVGGRLKFDQSDLDDFIAKGRVKPIGSFNGY